MNVYRIAFRLRGKEYQTISLSKSEQSAIASVEALAPGVEILRVESLGTPSRCHPKPGSLIVLPFRLVGYPEISLARSRSTNSSRHISV
jgi:hypothetical protein